MAFSVPLYVTSRRFFVISSQACCAHSTLECNCLKEGSLLLFLLFCFKTLNFKLYNVFIYIVFIAIAMSVTCFSYSLYFFRCITIWKQAESANCMLVINWLTLASGCNIGRWFGVDTSWAVGDVYRESDGIIITQPSFPCNNTNS